MDLLPTGSDKILELRTGKVNIVIKSKKKQVLVDPTAIMAQESTLEVQASALEQITVPGTDKRFGDGSVGMAFCTLKVMPLFLEQTDYEIVIRSRSGEPVSFWHENFGVREKVSRVIDDDPTLLTGVINFGNSVGYSDFEISVGGVRHAVIRIEVFPSKITYKEDYRNMLADISDEIFSVAIDFLKKTYTEIKIGDRTQSVPAVFFQIIKTIFDRFVRAADRIIAVPHHKLEVEHLVVPSYRAKAVDAKGVRWLVNHPEYVQKRGNVIAAEKVLSVRKQISYDTNENRFARFIIESTLRKLTDFKKRYTATQKSPDEEVICQADSMTGTLRRLVSDSFLSTVSPYSATQSMSLVFEMAPGYRELFKYYLLLHRGLSVTGDVFRVSMKDTAQLYEYWCFIRLVSILKKTTFTNKNGEQEKKYKLVSPDIIKTDNSGITVTLVKGQRSEVRFLNVTNGEQISLTYNPGEQHTQTVNQKPDNVLTLQKTGSDFEYKYIFDAKYRIEAQPDASYPDTKPGPKLDDINTMHRYRDSIVYESDKPSRFTFEKTMFGAYILFPYANEDEYEQHRFYKSIGSVNIGGLPFLPGSTRLVESFLTELITDSDESAFERASMPRGIENKLKTVDWSVYDVMVGSFRNEEQYRINFERKFYYAPASVVKNSLPVRYIALWRSSRTDNPGIRHYGEVLETRLVKRSAIPVPYQPSRGDEPYYLFIVRDWIPLEHPIVIRDEGVYAPRYTNLFLLLNSRESYELFKIKSEEMYRLVYELRRITGNIADGKPSDNGNGAICIGNDRNIWVSGNDIVLCSDNGEKIFTVSVNDFMKRPGKVVTEIAALHSSI